MNIVEGGGGIFLFSVMINRALEIDETKKRGLVKLCEYIPIDCRGVYNNL